MFPQALIAVGYIPGTTNPADALTKIFRDPIEIINSPIYRYGQEAFGIREGLEQDVVATCQAGVFQYKGLPSRFFQEARITYHKWENSMRTLGQVGHTERNLFDHQYTLTLNLTLSKEVYDRWSTKFFLVSRMLRAAAILASLELAQAHIIASKEELRKEEWGIILRSGQAHFPEGVKEMTETEIQGIQTTNLRLASHTARSLFGTKYIPILGRKDPLKEKVMRMAHLAGSQAHRAVHNLQKNTMANVTSGEVWVVLRDYKTDVKAHTRACGICRRFSEEKCRPSLGNTQLAAQQCRPIF